MNNISDILSRKPFFDTPKANEAEHFVNYVASNSLPKTRVGQPNTIRFSLRFVMQ